MSWRDALVARAAERPALAGAELAFDERLARHTTLRVGGPADAWVQPTSVAGVQEIRRFCHETGLPCRALGAGSNLLVRDGGVRGVVLSLEGLRGLAHHADGTHVEVEAGVSTGKLLSSVTAWELGGLEFLGGVPGSVGGGLVMNAGTYLGEFKDVTEEVSLVGPDGTLVTLPASACGFVYRGSALPADHVVVSARLALRPRPRAEIERDVRALRDRRRAREPKGVPNAGSFFKNPPGDYAGRLIEAAGLKGLRAGGAEVSAVHANWLVNVGDARAADFLALIETVRARVEATAGVRLDLEVRIIGEDATPAETADVGSEAERDVDGAVSNPHGRPARSSAPSAVPSSVSSCWGRERAGCPLPQGLGGAT